MKRNGIFYLHSITGLISGLFILLMSLSGAALVFHEELDSCQFPAITEIPDMPVCKIDNCYSQIQKQYPNAQISSASRAENTRSPYIFTIYDSSWKQGKESLQVFLHPQTAAIIGTRGSKDIRHNFMSWLSTFHNSFHLKKKGEWLLGVLSVTFLLSIVSGIVLYRRKIKAVLLFKKGLFTRHSIHQVIGVYALLFNLLIAGSGFWMQRYVFKKDFYADTPAYTPVIKPSPALYFSIDSAMEQVKKTYPHFTGYIFYFAQYKQRKTAVYGSQNTNSFIHNKKFADAVFLDSLGAIAKTSFVNEIPADNRRDIINAQIHYGRYGGWGVKLLYCVFGLSGGFLSITGFLLWIRRKK